MKWHVFAMLVSVAVSLIGLGLIVTQTAPYETSAGMRVLFFAGLLIFLWGMSSLITLYLRYRFGAEVTDKTIFSSYMIGFFASLVVLGVIAINIWT